MTIAAFGWTEDTELTAKLLNSLFIRLYEERYKNAVSPLEKYLIFEVKQECRMLYGFVLSNDSITETEKNDRIRFDSDFV